MVPFAPSLKKLLRQSREMTALYRLARMPDRVAAIEQRFAEREWATTNELKALRAQVDHLLSAADVPSSLAEEYRRWKASHPVPEQPIVSVCVATYNRARLLTERCIASVLQQTYPHLELIVVGDGCTDETQAAVCRIEDERLRFVNLPQRGVYPSDPMLRWMVAGIPALNAALSLAQGDYVTHLDDDDRYTPDRLEKLVRFAAQNDADFVWHPFWKEDAAGQWVLHEAPEFALGQVTTSSVFYRSWFTRIPLNIDACRLREPGDWNRYRQIKHLEPALMRYSEPLLWHHREGTQRA